MAPLGKMKTKRSRTCIGCCYYTAQCIIRDVLKLHDFWSKGGKLTVYVNLLLFLKIRTTQKPRRSRTLCNNTTTTTQNVVPLKWIFFLERERESSIFFLFCLYSNKRSSLLRRAVVLFEAPHSGGCYEIEVPSIIVRCQGRNLLPKDLESTQWCI